MADGSDDRGATGKVSSAESRGRSRPVAKAAGSKAAGARQGKLATSTPPRFLNRIPSRTSGSRSGSLSGSLSGAPGPFSRSGRSARSRGTGRSRIDYIPLTRVRFRGLLLSPAWCVLADSDERADRGDGPGAEVPALLSLLAVDGRPFAPRVAIDRDHLPGGGRLALQSDYATRLAHVGQLALSLEFPPWSPKRRGLSHDVGHALGHVLGKVFDRVFDQVPDQVPDHLPGGGISGVAFALLYSSSDDSRRSQRGEWMRTRAAIKSLDSVSLEEALAYLDASDGDELGAAFALATDRNELDGSAEAPDDAEVHHALFLLRRARKLEAPSFDLMRVQLKRRVAA